MKFLLYLLLTVAGAYATAHYVPAETRARTLASIGLSGFFEETLPTYLRSKLTIPENPVEKRQRLLSELSAAIGGIETELEAVVPPPPISSDVAEAVPGQTTTKTPAARSPTPPPAPKPITQSELRERMEKTKELLNQSETVLEELEKANPQQGFIAKATERILDKILPPPAPSASSGQTPTATDGIGGDAGGNPLCPQ